MTCFQISAGNSIMKLRLSFIILYVIYDKAYRQPWEYLDNPEMETSLWDSLNTEMWKGWQEQVIKIQKAWKIRLQVGHTSLIEYVEFWAQCALISFCIFGSAIHRVRVHS